MFGINEFAASFPNGIIGIITLLVIFNIGKKYFDEKFGIIWVLAYIGSFLPHFYFKTGIIDPTFNLFMFLGMYYLAELSYKQRFTPTLNINKELLLAGFMTSMAVLTKGPVGYLLVFLTWMAFWFLNRKKMNFPIKELIIFSVIAALPIIIWYIAILSQSGTGIISEFIMYQIRLLTTGDAGHEGPIYYHLIPLLIGCFPASILVFRAFRKQADDGDRQNAFRIWNLILLAVVLIIFSIVKTKILHYSSLAYFPITFLAAYTMYKVVYRSLNWKISSTILIWIFGGILSIGLTAFPIVLMNIKLFLPKITDKFTNALMQTPVEWLGFEQITGAILFFALIFFSIFIYKRKYLNAFISLFAGSYLTIMLFLPLMTPKIELYLQNEPINFYKKFIGKDVYVHNIGFKSYAPYFYSQKPLELSKYYLKMNGKDFENWLLTGNIDKDAHFVARINNYEEFMQKGKDIQLISIRNGYAFLKRNKVLTQ